MFDRHAATDLSVAYAISVPQRRARTARAGQEGRPQHDRSMTSAAIYARVSSARQKKDETIGSQTAALRAHAEQLGLDVPEEWVFEDDGPLRRHPGPARRWSGCATWSPGSGWTWCCATRRTGWPASSPTRRC